MDYQAYYRKVEDGNYQAYYDAIAAAEPRDPQATARTRDADGTIPGQARERMFNIAGEIQNTSREFGVPLPPLLEGCTVVDLCCGSGRDTYLAAQLVGPAGKVIGVEPNAARMRVGEKYLEKEMKQFGYDVPNVEFREGCPEDLSFIPDGSVDVVISNCTFNESPDKARYIAEVRRILREGGEWYFTDVFADRRMQREISDNIDNVALRLGGAMYINDFRRIAQQLGFNDPRYLITNKTPVTEKESALFDGASFATITCRLVNTPYTSDVCEDYGEFVTYKGGLPDFPDYFLFDKDIKFPVGKRCHVCNNVTSLVIPEFGGRYAAVFDYEGSRERHAGDTHGDHIIKVAPDFDGVVDEDDQPVRVSCC